MRNTKSVRNAKSMRKLHLVGVTTDMRGLIFTARKGSKSGGYVIAVDPKLVEAVDEAARRRNGGIPVAPRSSGADTMSGGASAAPAAPTGAGAPEVVAADGRPQSALSPREMQARLRAGRSIEEVAAEAGVGAEWVARFAVPILAEQAQVVALARGLTFAKPRLGESSLPLGLSVARNLAERGLSVPDDLFDPAWAAYQLHDSIWTVRFRHEARGRAYEANWELDVATGRLVARNRVASDLGYLDPSGRRRSETGAAATGSYDADPDDGRDAHPGSADDRPPRTSRAGSRLASPTRSVVRSSRTSTAPTRARGASRTGGPSGAPKRPEPPARASSRSSTEASRRSPSATSSSRGSRSPRPASEKPGSRGDSDGKKGPTVRGGGIRAATAQVTSAQVAASRTIVARTVLPAPRPPAMRRGEFDHGTPGERTGSEGRASTGTSRDQHYPQDSAATRRRAPSRATTERPLRHEDPEPDSLIDDLLLDTPTERAPASSAARSSSGEGRHPAQPTDEDDDEPEVAPFRLRPRPDAAAPAPTQAVTRVRSGGPTGLARTTLSTGGGNAKRGDAGANGDRKRASDRREPLRVPSVLSPASGPDRGMPAPRQRSRRLLRRPR